MPRWPASRFVCNRQGLLSRSEALCHLWERLELASSAKMEVNERYIAGALPAPRGDP